MSNIRFGKANTKIRKLAKHKTVGRFLQGNRKVYSFDLSAGYACPFARECKSCVVQIGGKPKIKDGEHTKWRCFSASQEVMWSSVRNRRATNLSAIRECKTVGQIADKLRGAIPKDVGVVRIHVSGDFFSLKYFRAWCRVAKDNPTVLFYAYTKSIKWWVLLRDNGEIPKNLVLTASYGGSQDHLIEKHGLRYVKVIADKYRVGRIKKYGYKTVGGLPIDHDDSHAANPRSKNRSFCLLVHSTQPPKSEASQAVMILR